MNDNFGISDLFFLNKKYFKIVGTITISVFIFSIFYSLISQPLFKSYISIYPTRDQNMPAFSGLNGIASTFGFNLPSESNTYNISDLYLPNQN